MDLYGRFYILQTLSILEEAALWILFFTPLIVFSLNVIKNNTWDLLMELWGYILQKRLGNTDLSLRFISL